MKKMLHIFIFCLSAMNIFAQPQTQQQQSKPLKHPEYEQYFNMFGMKGSFGLYDLNNDKYHCYDCYANDTASSPASTFKILNTLIALETGIATDENFELKWDNVDRKNENWNKDQTLKEAFQNSTVWFYQEIARRVGEKKMKELVRKAGYGNGVLTGGVDQFWLNGSLKITPKQQIDFLRKLYKNELPFSKRAMDLTKKIMLAEETSTFKMYAKTGWDAGEKRDVGWYVGWVEQGENVYFFATRVINDDKANEDFAKARIEITKNILRKHYKLL